MGKKKVKKHDIFYTEDDGNILYIRFDKIFKQPMLDVFTDFDVRSRRTFKNIVDEITDTYKEIFLDENGEFKHHLSPIMFNMLNVKSELEFINARPEPTEEDLKRMDESQRAEARMRLDSDTWNSTSYDEFIEMLDSVIGNLRLDSRGLPVESVDLSINDFEIGNSPEESLLLRTINDYVEEGYELNLDEITEDAESRNRKINVELQFTDYHARTLIKTAYLFRLMIPLISTYFDLNKDQFPRNVEEMDNPDLEDMEFNDIFLNIFTHMFESFFGRRAVAIRNKLYKLILSRIARTLYSNRRFWNIAENQGITRQSVSADIYKKIITNAIPKLSLDKEHNTVSFLLAIINNQIDFNFQDKFTSKIMTLGNKQERYSDTDEISEFERLEMLMLRDDEGLVQIRRNSIVRNMRKLDEYFGVTVDEDEIKKFIGKLPVHRMQETIISTITYDLFKDLSAIKMIDYVQYVTLVLYTRKYLQKHKLNLLADVLVSSVSKLSEREKITGNRVRPWIESSKEYIELFNKKFNKFPELVQRPVNELIATIYSSTFHMPDGTLTLSSNIKVDIVAGEVISFFKLV